MPNCNPLIHAPTGMYREGSRTDALGRLGDTRAETHLKECLSTDNCYVRIAAEEALERLKK